MTLKPRPPLTEDEADEAGGERYVSVVTGDQFAEFATAKPPVNGVNGDGVAEEEDDYAAYEGSEYIDEEDGKKGGNNLANKFSSAKDAIFNFRMPSASELKASYINSGFHKSFNQPLMVKAKVERPDVQRARQAVTQERNPAQLSEIHGLSDIPMPKLHSGGAGGKTPSGSVAEINGASSKINLHNLTLPRSLREQQLITGVKEAPADDETLTKRMELTKTKTPAQLAEIHSFSEFPVPTRLKNLFEKPNLTRTFEDQNGNTEQAEAGRTEGFYGTLPRSLRETKLVTNVKVEADESVLAARKQLVDTKSPAELSAIHGFSDIPIPSRLEKYATLKRPGKKSTSTPGGLDATSLTSKDFSKLTLPECFTMELAVKTKVETNLEQLEQRRKLVSEKKPADLAAIQSFADFPVPTPVSNLIKSIQGVGGAANATADDSGSVDDSGKRRQSRAKKRERNLTIGGIFSTDTSPFVPESMRETKLVVRAKVEADPEVLAARQQLVKTSSPAELGAINTFDDLPLPAAIKNLTLKRIKSEKSKKQNGDVGADGGEGDSLALPPEDGSSSGRNMLYNSLPRSLRDQQLIVRSKTEDDVEELKRRQELTRTKTPTELSQISGLADLPIPAKIESMIRTVSPSGNPDSPAPPPRQKWRKEDIYESLPSSLRSELIVRSREIVDEDELNQRKEIIRSHTPVQLSEIHSMKDLPIPKFLENKLKMFESKPTAEDNGAEKEPFTIYGTLPASLKTGLVVKVKQEEPHVQQERAEIIKSKSVNELSQIHSLADLPIPNTLTNLAKRGYAPVERKKKFKEQMGQGRGSSMASISHSLHSTLPRSLSEKQLLVRARMEDPDVLAVRRELVSSKSVSELSQVNSFNDFPVPSNLSRMYRKSMERLDKLFNNSAASKAFSSPDVNNGLSEPNSRPMSRGAHSVRSDLYSTLPRSLTDQLLVRTKVETDEAILRERQALVESKSPAELGKIHNLEDLPVPTRVQAWLHQLEGLRSQEKLTNGSGEEPEPPKKVADIMYRTLPASLSQPCVVRSKVEDPARLIERQQLQQTKSIHELSKIRNLNEVPIPLDLFKLPDVPIPKMRTLLNTIARPPSRKKSVSNKSGSSLNNDSFPQTPDGDFKMNPSDANKLYSEISDDNEDGQQQQLQHLDAEYEVVMKPHKPTQEEVEQALAENNHGGGEEEFDTFGLADQVKGTPERPRAKKKPSSSSSRRSRDTEDDTRQIAATLTANNDEPPPPLPPKRVTASPMKTGGMSASVDSQESTEEYPVKPVKASLQLKLGIQSMPLPAPPAPPRTLKKRSESTEEPPYADGDDITYNTCTENFRTAAETLNSRTLVEISSITQRVDDSTEDVTLADSVVDNMVSCADTLCGDSETTLADQLCDDDDNPYPSVMFESDRRGAKRTSRRLEEGTQQLSVELMEHVESLRTTLDNMSSKLGNRSRSRSASRSGSRPRQ